MNKEVRTRKPSRKLLQEIIGDGNAIKLIGLEEMSYFEVRKRSYMTKVTDKVTHEKAKQTLLTDITSISNSGGGYILIGLTTTLKENQRVEYVSEVSGVSKEHIALDSWSNIITENTVPRFSFNLLSHGYIGENDEVFWMEIPDAKKLGLYPVMVKNAKWVVDESNLLRGNYYGLFYRDGSENTPESPEKIQQVLANGMATNINAQQVTIAQYEQIAAKMDELTDSLHNMNKGNTEQDRVKPYLANARNKLSQDLGMFYMYAHPKKPSQLPNFWDNNFKNNNIYTLVKQPPTLRNMGWDLQVASSEFPYTNGASWEITNGERKLLQVTKTADAFVAMSIHMGLDWGTKQYMEPDGPEVLISELALVEYIYNFAQFVSELRKRQPSLGDFEVTAGFELPSGTSAGLLRGDRISTHVLYNASGKLGEVRKWNSDFHWGIKPANDAAQLALDITMGGFGAVQPPISVINDASGTPTVDVEFYKNIHN